MLHAGHQSVRLPNCTITDRATEKQIRVFQTSCIGVCRSKRRMVTRQRTHVNVIEMQTRLVTSKCLGLWLIALQRENMKIIENMMKATQRFADWRCTPNPGIMVKVYGFLSHNMHSGRDQARADLKLGSTKEFFLNVGKSLRFDHAVLVGCVARVYFGFRIVEKHCGNVEKHKSGNTCWNQISKGWTDWAVEVCWNWRVRRTIRFFYILACRLHLKGFKSRKQLLCLLVRSSVGQHTYLQRKLDMTT